MESWRKVFRDGLAPHISTAGLVALETALATDDKRLIQGATTAPPPLQSVKDWPVEAADAIGFTGWQGEGLETLEEVDQYFGEICFQADQVLGEPAAVRWFLNAYDEWSRDVMLKELLPEVRRVLAERSDMAEVA